MIHPIEYRYCFPEMKGLFDEESKLKKMLEVEVALARAHAKLGRIRKSDANTIARAAKQVRLARVKEIEKTTHHDVMSMAEALAEKSGKAGRWVHVGATSYDIIDSMWGLILKDAVAVLENDLKLVKGELRKLAKRHEHTVMVGRTHGQHALPITFGFKCAIWLNDVCVHEQRLKELKKRLLVGKMSGAVGTFAGFGTDRIQKEVMRELGLGEPRITNQVVQREALAELLAYSGIVAGTIEKVAKEIRNLSRSEIKEVEESFAGGQVGSSTMPQKRNPHKSENVCGIARVIRSNVSVGLEDISLEHERDLTNSSAERIVLPETLILLDYSLRRLASILHGLKVYPKRMKKTLESDPYVMGESVMLALVGKGIPRQEAHRMVKKAAMDSFSGGGDFAGNIRKTAKGLLSEKELEAALNPYSYLGEAGKRVEKVLRECK